MLPFDVRYAVASSTGRRVLLGAFERQVVVKDLASDTTSDVHELVYDFGGRRLALTDELDGIVAAAYHRHGLAFYRLPDGRELWRRKDLKKIQHVTLSRNGLLAYCGREGTSLEVVALETGETVERIRGARAVYESSYDAVRFVDAHHPYVADDQGRRLFRVERLKFAFLHVVFAPGIVVTTETGGPVRCLQLETGMELWRYNPKWGRHVVHLGFRESEPSILGVEWNYMRGGARRLVRLSVEDGKPLEIGILRQGKPEDCCFAHRGEVVVLADGTVLPTALHAKPSKTQVNPLWV